MTTYETCSGCRTTFRVPYTAWNSGEGWRHDYCSEECYVYDTRASKPKDGAAGKPKDDDAAWLRWLAEQIEWGVDVWRLGHKDAARLREIAKTMGKRP